MNEVIILIAETFAVDDVGNSVATPTEREVFAKVKSVGGKYKLEAMASGLYPQYRFVLADVLDYQDETRAKYKGKEYRIIDTYQGEDNTIELTVEAVI